MVGVSRALILRIEHLLVLVNGQPFCIEQTSIVRNGVSKMFKHDGYWGYEFTLPSNINKLAQINGLLKVEIRSPYGSTYEERVASTEINVKNEHESIVFYDKIELTKKSFNDIDLEKTIGQEKGVSIVLINFNGGEIVIHSINSILTKMRQEDELIIIDHGSTDGSLEKSKRLMMKII